MDTVGNMLTSIVNAQRIGKERVVVPYSKFTYELAKMLQEEGLVAKCRVQANPKKSLIIKLVYENGEPKIKRVKYSLLYYQGSGGYTDQH